MLTSSFTGQKNYMRELGELMGDAEAMKHFGNTVVVWDFHARKPLQTLEVPGAPLEIRWALAAAPRLRLHRDRAHRRSSGASIRKPDGSFEAVEVADIGDPAKTPLPGRHQPLGRRPLPLRRHASWTARCASST